MSLAAMGTSIATPPLGLMRASRSLSVCSKRKVRLDTRLWLSLKADVAELFLCIGWFAKLFTAKNQHPKVLFATSTDRGRLMCQAILFGEATPRTRQTSDVMDGWHPGNGTDKPSFRKKAFGSFGHLSHLAFGMRQTLRKYLALTHQQFAASPPQRGIGKKLNNSLHSPGAWDANPWVVALTFTVKRGNIDKIGDANG